MFYRYDLFLCYGNLLNFIILEWYTNGIIFHICFRNKEL